MLTDAASLLVAVNSGSNSVSTLAAGTAGLALISTVSSEGSFPNSFAVRGTLVYVLNAHTPNMSG